MLVKRMFVRESTCETGCASYPCAVVKVTRMDLLTSLGDHSDKLPTFHAAIIVEGDLLHSDGTSFDIPVELKAKGSPGTEDRKWHRLCNLFWQGGACDTVFSQGFWLLCCLGSHNMTEEQARLAKD